MDAQKVLDAVSVWSSKPNWFIVGDGDHPKSDDYIRSFDSLMDNMVAHARSDQKNTYLGIAIAFSSAEKGDKRSYRQILKKYTRSVVFTDLQIHLLLVREDGTAEMIVPIEVNNFLDNLNAYIISKRAESRGDGRSI